jgi:uncharacterized protein (DUF983 family)
MIRRALLRRCPNCGSGGIFKGWFALRDRCPHCGHVYSREQGYWVMAIIINTAVTEGIFGILFVAGLILTAPGFPVLPLLAIGIGTNAIVPLVFYPFSKSIWVAIDLYMHPAGQG